MIRRAAALAGLALLIACSSAPTDDDVATTMNALGTGACPDVPNAQCLEVFCGTSGAGCTGTASGGGVQGVNLGAATSSSGCFTSSTSSACL